MVNPAVFAVAGLGAGVAIGYLLPSMFGPKITISPNPAAKGQAITFTYSGFPANTALMSMGGGTNGIGSAPINIGQTDQNGNLQINGTAPDLQSGTTILYVIFAAQNPNTYATTVYTQA